MYEIKFLPSAKNDMTEIIRYICLELKNPQAAQRVMNELQNGVERIQSFLYSNPVYRPVRDLKHEYRKLSVGSYLMFYLVDEADKSVTVAGVIYAARDYENLLR